MILLQVYINTAVWEERLKVVICNLLNHGAVKNSLKRFRTFQFELEFGSVGF